MRKMLTMLAISCAWSGVAMAQQAPAQRPDSTYTGGAMITRWGKAVTPENVWRS